MGRCFCKPKIPRKPPEAGGGARSGLSLLRHLGPLPASRAARPEQRLFQPAVCGALLWLPRDPETLPPAVGPAKSQRVGDARSPRAQMAACGGHAPGGSRGPEGPRELRCSSHGHPGAPPLILTRRFSEESSALGLAPSPLRQVPAPELRFGSPQTPGPSRCRLQPPRRHLPQFNLRPKDSYT